MVDALFLVSLAITECPVPPGVEYIKVVLTSGRMVGAVLIGDTDLEVRGRGRPFISFP